MIFKIKKSHQLEIVRQVLSLQMEVNISQNQSSYQSYLLRLWQVGNSFSPVEAWRASLENPHTGEILKFSSLENLFEFLADQCRNDVSSKSTLSE